MIFEDVLTVMNTITKLVIIESEYNGPQPTQPYITVRLGTARISPIHKSAVDDEGNQILSSHRYREVQIQIYGRDSDSIAEELAMRMRTEDFIEQSEAVGLVWSEQIRTQYIPVLVDKAKYESRTIIDLVVAYTANLEQEVGVIEHVQGTATLDDLETPYAADL